MEAKIMTIYCDSAPKPFGHYVQAASACGLLFVSGQLAARIDGSSTAHLPFDEQARQALSNVISIARSAGCTTQDFVKVTVYIVGVANWASFNSIFSEFFGENRPARAVVPVPELHNDYLIEIDAVVLHEQIQATE